MALTHTIEASAEAPSYPVAKAFHISPTVLSRKEAALVTSGTLGSTAEWDTTGSAPNTSDFNPHAVPSWLGEPGPVAYTEPWFSLQEVGVRQHYLVGYWESVRANQGGRLDTGPGTAPVPPLPFSPQELHVNFPSNAP